MGIYLNIDKKKACFVYHVKAALSPCMARNMDPAQVVNRWLLTCYGHQWRLEVPMRFNLRERNIVCTIQCQEVNVMTPAYTFYNLDYKMKRKRLAFSISRSVKA